MDPIKALNFNGPISSVANWNAWAPPELQNRLPFRPIVRGLSQVNDPSEWGIIYPATSTLSYTISTSQNAQVSITAEQAAELWREKMVPLRREKGKKLVGPGCASDKAGEKWLKEFMERLCELGEPPDYLGLPFYYGPDGSAAIEYIGRMWDTDLLIVFSFRPGS
ncbi:uncharacterized protein RCO7_11039 [Rhynchosporium graminicola]|uniref:Asl1-like glycosyl hydrolase catalytic domain-containing protein n=1 Tax=Rhynchosporium graminicola TaxID=2792576 RepID=A0A1E1KVS3_9HELO|nr:uncharacterized protein RCO7_11039 [Rhynchosporium commune]